MIIVFVGVWRLSDITVLLESEFTMSVDYFLCGTDEVLDISIFSFLLGLS